MAQLSRQDWDSLVGYLMKAIPDSLYESATIDGAGDFRIYWQIFLPLAIPSLATVGLFLALGYWNEWYNAMLYIQTTSKYPLQYFLQKMVNQANVQQLISQGVQIDLSDLPTQSIKMATAVVATGPVILFYPFLPYRPAHRLSWSEFLLLKRTSSFQCSSKK